MKVRHILINILPLPLWIAYYLVTVSNKELFITRIDEMVYLTVMIVFTVFNLFSEKVVVFLLRNLIAVISATVGCLVSGHIYLSLCRHMSDEHNSMYLVSFDMAKLALIITVIGCVASYFILKIKKSNGGKKNDN